MKDNATGSLDRRDFVIASLATVGASAAFVATAGAADAQDKAASARPTGTVYTGDLIGGKKVISVLDVKDLEPPAGNTPFIFRACRCLQDSTGMYP